MFTKYSNRTVSGRPTIEIILITDHDINNDHMNHIIGVFLYTDEFKMSLCTEAKAWQVAYGRAMNKQYHTMMEDIFTQLEDISKQLSRPIKDLDDIRTAMAALKEIRENEIRIDMSLSPIEVCYTISILL